MKGYKKTNPEVWTGRKSERSLYLHEKVKCLDLEKEELACTSQKTVALLGYACSEGVRRNQGRFGAADGPESIRKQLGKMPNHLNTTTEFLDAGTVLCLDGDMEAAQNNLCKKVSSLLENNAFLILLGGGHDIAYGHFNGIKNYIGNDKSIGIINFDAHFDLRSNENGNNSGTPFFQIAQDCKENNSVFKYLCLGIRKDANDKVLFQKATDLGVRYIENTDFKAVCSEQISLVVSDFIRAVDHIYVTIDLDGFSSAYAPGVSAPSPMGFSPAIVLKTLRVIIDSKKLLSLDIAEMNPKYDRDDQTSKLAASLVHFVMHQS